MNIHEDTLEIARSLIHKDPSLKDWVVSKFPELKESEDERARKAIIELVKQSSEVLNEQNKKEMLAWLEKQGGQKPADKVEPKFKVGDWIISSEGTLRHIIAVGRTGYETDKGWLTHDYYEKSFHLWTIKDAKDGDVLATHLSPEGDWIGIYKESVDILGFKTYCFLNGVGEFVINQNRCRNHGTHGLHPAIKEQCDFLFSKMKEAGYEWDGEKKELKKIEQKPAEWSENDEQMINDIIEAIDTPYSDQELEMVTWLKSLKGRLQPKQDWSEEDERLLSKLQTYVDMECFDRECNGDDLINWLKSLKPQPHWKPSDEQLRPLEYAIDYFKKKKNDTTYLESLYNDLKEL